jgi:transcriptional regulator NrdR family protein
VSKIKYKNILPLTWVELQEGYRYLGKNKLHIPEYKIVLASSEKCSKVDCFFHNIAKLPVFNPTNLQPLTYSIQTNFTDEFICDTHQLPLTPSNTFENSQNDMDYLYSATSFVKLKKYDFNRLINNCYERFQNEETNENTLLRIIKKAINPLSSKYNNHLEKEMRELLEQAENGKINRINDLRNVLAYSRELEFRKNNKTTQILSLVLEEFKNIYIDYNIYYKNYKFEQNPINDFEKLNKQFNIYIKKQFFKMLELLSKNYDLSEPLRSYELVKKNYDGVRDKFFELNPEFSDNQIFLSLQGEPNQNALFDPSYISSNPSNTCVYMYQDLIPTGEMITRQDRNMLGQGRALYKIAFEDFLNFYLFFNRILDSSMHSSKDKSLVLDASVLWDRDHQSPFYEFDKAVDLTKII